MKTSEPPTQAPECPLCGEPNTTSARCCADCKSVLASVAISESQALEDARLIREWKVRR